jgi:hypothetical protein
MKVLILINNIPKYYIKNGFIYETKTNKKINKENKSKLKKIK